MRDRVTGFYVDVLERLLKQGTLATADRVLVVCGGPLDDAVMRTVGFNEFVITNIEGSAGARPQDAQNLSFDDGAFDAVIVHAGLHHCHSPHRALLEMYRVARKCVIAFEARDSFVMRTAVR